MLIIKANEARYVCSGHKSNCPRKAMSLSIMVTVTIPRCRPLVRRDWAE